MHTGLISQALVIGRVQAAVYWTEDGVRALRREAGGYADCSGQAPMLLDLPAEKRLLTGISLAQLQDSLALWSDRQALLHGLIAGMDAVLSDETRRLGLELAEVQAALDPDAMGFARARLLGCPLPEGADLDGALNLAGDMERCGALYRELHQVHEWIEPVSRALREVVYFDFPGDAPADALYRALVDRGVVATMVLRVARGEAAGSEDWVVRFGGDAELLAACPRLPHLLAAISARIKREFGTAVRPQVPTQARPAASEIHEQRDAILDAAREYSQERRHAKDHQRPQAGLRSESAGQHRQAEILHSGADRQGPQC